MRVARSTMICSEIMFHGILILVFVVYWDKSANVLLFLRAADSDSKPETLSLSFLCFILILIFWNFLGMASYLPICTIDI
jgi:hypothetical protein